MDEYHRAMEAYARRDTLLRGYGLSLEECRGIHDDDWPFVDRVLANGAFLATVRDPARFEQLKRSAEQIGFLCDELGEVPPEHSGRVRSLMGCKRVIDSVVLALADRYQ